MLNKYLKRLLIALITVLILSASAFGIYTSDYYHAGATATALSRESDVSTINHGLALTADSDIGIIFYPGAKVAYTAYLPLLDRLQEAGYNCFLTKMPFNLAFFGKNRAEEIIQAHPEIDAWYMAGHSLGGAFAGAYASDHAFEISGLILLGAYRYSDYPSEKTIIIYGSEDQVLNREKISDSDRVYIIDGGNHAQFGDYGSQKGDGIPTISMDEQLSQTIDIIETFIKTKQE